MSVNKIIPASKEVRDQMEWQRQKPRPSLEKVKAQFRASEKLRRSAEYQAKHKHKFSELGRDQ